MLGEALLIGRFDHTGRVDAQWHQPYYGMMSRWSHRIQCRLSPSSQQPDTELVAEFERRGEDNTANVKLGFGLASLSYFQAVTPRIAVGGEAVYLKKLGTPILSARARYTDNNHTLVCTASPAGSLSATFLRRVSNRLGLACELEMGLQGSQMSFGAEFVMRQAKFQANITSTGTIQTTLQDIIANNCFLLLSATVDHRHDIYRFGAGIQLG